MSIPLQPHLTIKSLVRIVAATAWLSLLPSSPLKAASVGEQAPPFSLPLLSTEAQQQIVSLSSQSGRVVYLDFWASWCPPCRISFPFMKQLQQQYRKEQVHIIAISLDQSRTDLKPFLDQYGDIITILHDPDAAVAERYGVLAMPSSYLIDRSGKISAVHHGFRQQTVTTVEEQIRQLLNNY